MGCLLNLPSPHPRRLPDKTEVRQCKVAIEALDRDIAHVTIQMQKLAAQLQGLNQKRENYASYIASFCRLPVEILSEIAITCLYHDIKIITLTSIHSSLREAVIGMSSLWRFIMLLHPSRSKSSFTYCRLSQKIICSTREQLDVVLRRAGSVPLRLDCLSNAWNFTPLTLRPLLFIS